MSGIHEKIRPSDSHNPSVYTSLVSCRPSQSEAVRCFAQMSNSVHWRSFLPTVFAAAHKFDNFWLTLGKNLPGFPFGFTLGLGQKLGYSCEFCAILRAASNHCCTLISCSESPVISPTAGGEC